MSRPTRHDPQNAGSTARGSATQPCRRQGGNSLVALLIAGEREQADRYASRLRADGYTVVPATGLEPGLDLASVTRPDLIFVCLGSWAVPTLVLLMLRSDRSTRGVPVVLVTDESRTELAIEVGGLRPTEHVVPRRSKVPTARSQAWPERRPGCSRRSRFDRWLGH